MACGDEHMLIITLDNVFSIGSNEEGQLGLADLFPKEAPQAIHILKGQEITMISTSKNHSGCINSSGKVYLWGNNRFFIFFNFLFFFEFLES